MIEFNYHVNEVNEISVIGSQLTTFLVILCPVPDQRGEGL